MDLRAGLGTFRKRNLLALKGMVTVKLVNSRNALFFPGHLLLVQRLAHVLLAV
jgi:hypothetical protein